jgi:hypothetical protein
MSIIKRLEKFLVSEEVYRLCRNFDNAGSRCKITCHNENVMMGDKCPYQKFSESKCDCFKSSKNKPNN